MRREDKEKKPQTNAKDWRYGFLLKDSLGGAAAKWSLLMVWVTLMQSLQHVHPAEAQVSTGIYISDHNLLLSSK